MGKSNTSNNYVLYYTFQTTIASKMFENKKVFCVPTSRRHHAAAANSQRTKVKRLVSKSSANTLLTKVLSVKSQYPEKCENKKHVEAQTNSKRTILKPLRQI